VPENFTLTLQAGYIKMCFQTSQRFSQQKGELVPRNSHYEYMHVHLVSMNIKL